MIRITKLILKAIYWKNIIKMYSYTMRIYNVKWFLLFNNSYLNFFYCLKVILMTIRFRIFIFQFLNYSRGYTFSNSYFLTIYFFFILINDWCCNSKKISMNDTTLTLPQLPRYEFTSAKWKKKSICCFDMHNEWWSLA